MVGTPSFWKGFGLMVFTIALMECGYRLVYWCWMEVYPHSSTNRRGGSRIPSGLW